MARIRIEDKGTIYKIINNINNKIYVGQTKRSVHERWQQHIKSSRYNYCTDYSTKIHRAIRKYGIKNFSIFIIETCDILLLNEREQYWINFYNSIDDGYNITKGGNGYSLYDYNEIYKKWLENKSCSQIIEETGISYTTLSEILNRFNVPIKERQDRGIDNKIKINKELIKKAFLLGESINKIHLKYKVSTNWIKRVLLDFNFTEQQIIENGRRSHKTSGSPVKIEQYDKTKQYIQTFNSIKDAKNFLNKKENNTSLNHILKHDNDLHYYDNYYWRYVT